MPKKTKKSDAADDEGIKIYLRVRPSKKATKVWDMDPEEGDFRFKVPVNKGLDLVNNTRSNYAFKFDGILGMDATQEDVFESVARGPVLSAIEGYNATVFAYGQTGSGKTFTITGGAESYSDRGIIPRALSMIFEEFEKRSGDTAFRAFISFMEIYNGKGYDLLDPAHETKGAEAMIPKVTMLEDENGHVHLRNLSLHSARSEEEALNLLFLGDTNRAISETAMNTNSSRSHCIFTVSIEARPIGSDTIRRSKLHLVDLAGSERVHKTGSKGKTLKEAGYINVSLHCLEMVIIALQEKRKTGRAHIPYRNSMMTSMLRDSLGGNCKTSMIATMSPDVLQTDESISTCRFAQRVARVKNTASVNEELDPTLVIKRLKAEIKMLKEEILFLKGGVDGADARGSHSGGGASMTTTERNHLRKRIEMFLDDPDESTTLALGSSAGAMSFERVQSAFSIIKSIVRERRPTHDVTRSSRTASSLPPRARRDAGAKVREEDEEEDEESDDDETEGKVAARRRRDGRRQRRHPADASFHDDDRSDRSSTSENVRSKRAPRTRNAHGKENAYERRTSRSHLSARRSLPPPSNEILDDKKASFEYFRKRHDRHESMEQNKRALKEKYEDAKMAGRSVNKSRKRIGLLKSRVEKVRVERALSSGGKLPDDYEPGEDEREWIHEIEKEKRKYKLKFQELKALKREIEHTQKLIERSRKLLVREFEPWYASAKRGALSSMVDERHADGAGHESAGDHAPIPPKDGDRRTGPPGSVTDDITAFYAAKQELLSRLRGGFGK